MTREEAIEFGNMWLQINEDCKDSSTYSFFQMAIKALEQEMGCEGCKYEKTGTNSTYPCSHCRRCYTDKYKVESEE